MRLVIRTDVEREHDDERGAFGPESMAYAAYWVSRGDEVVVRDFDDEDVSARRMQEVEAILAQHPDAEHVAVFCHGGRRWLQTGHEGSFPAAPDGDIDSLAQAMPQAMRTLTLYACSVGYEGGFACALSERLRAHSTVFRYLNAHTTKGHTTRNPHVVRYDGYLKQGATKPEGENLVIPGGRAWNAWKTALHTPLRFDLERARDMVLGVKGR